MVVFCTAVPWRSWGSFAAKWIPNVRIIFNSSYPLKFCRSSLLNAARCWNNGASFIYFHFLGVTILRIASFNFRRFNLKEVRGTYPSNPLQSITADWNPHLDVWYLSLRQTIRDGLDEIADSNYSPDPDTIWCTRFAASLNPLPALSLSGVFVLARGRNLLDTGCADGSRVSHDLLVSRGWIVVVNWSCASWSCFLARQWIYQPVRAWQHLPEWTMSDRTGDLFMKRSKQY